jgi:hypothetical protein
VVPDRVICNDHQRARAELSTSVWGLWLRSGSVVRAMQHVVGQTQTSEPRLAQRVPIGQLQVLGLRYNLTVR